MVSPPAPRGVPQIEVTFDIDANGIINVSATDKGTGKTHDIRIEASSGLTQEEIERMKRDAEANAEADKKAQEVATKMNEADALIFQTEKQLKDFGDKIPADKKSAIESALEELKGAYESKDIAAINVALEKINEAWKKASEDIYKAQQEGGAAGGHSSYEAQDQQPNNGGGDNNVQDVDFEEVK